MICTIKENSYVPQLANLTVEHLSAENGISKVLVLANRHYRREFYTLDRVMVDIDTQKRDFVHLGALHYKTDELRGMEFTILTDLLEVVS